jgi:two-component system, NarL family, response regulator DevR
MEKIKVFLADPQVLFREGIHFILSGEEDFEVTGETTGNEEALSLIETNPPNVAILSMHDAKTNGAVVTSHIRRNMPSVFVILIMDKKEPDIVFNAVKSGASACLTKDTDPEQLLNTIRIVAQGSLPAIDELFNPSVASLVLNEFEDSSALNEQFDNMLATLTPREKQILNLIASGSKIEQIAIKTDTDEDAIRHNIRTILTKLIANEQTRNIIEAAQRSMPSLIRSGKMNGKVHDYVTKVEFNEFRDTLMERMKSFIGELVPEPKSKK